MTDHEAILNALCDGDESDATVAAALDCYREQTGCTLLAAVVEVARVHGAQRDARDIATAQAHLELASPICRALRLRVAHACPNVPDGTYTWIMVTPGDAGPVVNLSLDSGAYHALAVGCILVGARWVTRAAEQIIRAREVSRNRRSRRRSR